MKKTNKKIMSSILFVAIICILFIIAFNFSTLVAKIQALTKAEVTRREITYDIYSYENGIIKLVIMAEDTENGLRKVTYPNNEAFIDANGKQKVAIDYEIREDGTYTFKATDTTGNEIEKTLVVDKNFRENIIPTQIISESESQVAVISDFKDTTSNYYKIGKDTTNWTEYKNGIRIDFYQVPDNLKNDDGTLTIQLKQLNSNNQVVLIERTIDSINLNPYKEEETIIEGESLLACVENNDLQNGNYKFKINGEEYPAEVYNYNGDSIYIAQNEVTINEETYYGLGSNQADTKMLVLKYNGNLTIQKNAKITPSTRKKGMFIYTSGTIENNGEISMTARGAVAEGQDVYLLKNSNGLYEYVPKDGGIGADGLTRGLGANHVEPGLKGGDANYRGTGGGGSGALKFDANNSGGPGKAVSGSGSNGTSYSGGSGGGGVNTRVLYNTSAQDAQPNGGKGGDSGKGYSSYNLYNAGGGAGNPGGTGKGSTNGNGENGTGGLLILYSNILKNNGNITSEGSRGGSGYMTVQGEGGSSGGGSINIFAKDEIVSGNISANGGNTEGGGKGGNGSISKSLVGFELGNNQLEIYKEVGKDTQQQLVVSKIPDKYKDKKINWSSSNTNVLEINQDGIVTIKKAGEEYIKATIEGTDFEAYCLFKIYIRAIGEKDTETGKNMLNLEKYIDEIEQKGEIYIPEGTYTLVPYKISSYATTGVFDKQKEITIRGDNQKTTIIFNGADSLETRDANAIMLQNKNSILRNLIYEYYPNRSNNYSNAIFNSTLGSVENVYIRIKGNTKASYLYSTGPSIIKNCTFYFDLKANDSNYSGTATYKDIVTNILPASGTQNAIQLDFEGNIEATKTNKQVTDAQSGVYFGTNAWK